MIAPKRCRVFTDLQSMNALTKSWACASARQNSYQLSSYRRPLTGLSHLNPRRFKSERAKARWGGKGKLRDFKTARKRALHDRTNAPEPDGSSRGGARPAHGAYAAP